MEATRSRWGWAVALLLLPIFGCGGSGGTSPAAPCAAPTFTTLSGAWTVRETPSSNCGDDQLDVYGITLTQNGSAITVTVTSSGRSYTGTMCGNTITAHTPFSYPDGAGTTTNTSVVITVNSNNSATFNSAWSYSEVGFACSGTSTGTVTR